MATRYIGANADRFTAGQGPLMFRNRIINGNFGIWQRGTSQTSSGYGSADRWRCEHAGSTKTASQQAFTIGQTAVPNNPKYFLRHVVTSAAGAGNYCIAAQRIEDVVTFSGQTVTVSFWAKADASRNISLELYQDFGTGGSPSAGVSTPATGLIPLTTTWTYFTKTVTLPSISGKVVGTANDSNLACIFWFDAGSSFNARSNSLGQQSGTFDIAQVQIELGSSATEFEQRPLGLELSLCQRYYFQVTGIASLCNCFARTSTMATGVLHHPVEMRISPAVETNTTTGVAYAAAELGGADFSNLAVAKSGGNNSNNKATAINGTNASAVMTAGHGGRLMLSNAAAYVGFNAEL